MNLSCISNLTVREIPLLFALTWLPKYRKLSELQDQLDHTSEALSFNLPMVDTPSLLKKVVTLGVKMRNPEDLTGGIHPFFLGHHTAFQRKSASTAANRYSTVVRREESPSITNTYILSAPDGVSLPEAFL